MYVCFLYIFVMKTTSVQSFAGYTYVVPYINIFTIRVDATNRSRIAG